MKVDFIKNAMLRDEMRLDSSFHLSPGVLWRRKIHNGKYDFLGNLVERVFGAGRDKRVYTQKKNGIPFLSNTDVSSNDPFSNCKYVSKKYGYDPKSIIERGMVLTGRVGAIGQVSYVRDDMVGAVASDNIIRIVADKQKIFPGYLYVFLSSSIGKALLW